MISHIWLHSVLLRSLGSVLGQLLIVRYYGADFIAATVLKSENGKSVGFPLFTLLLCTNNSNTSDDP